MNLFNLWKQKKEIKFEELNSSEIPEDSRKPEISEIVDLSVHSKSKGEFSVSNPLMKLTETELRDLCRHHIDTFENWSRRIIDETFKTRYDPDYFNFMISENQPLIKSEIKRRKEA